MTSAASALKDVTNHKRFGPITTLPEREKAARGAIPSNTEASTRWALKNFKLWATNHPAVNPSDPVPADLLESLDPNLVCRWLCRYVMETRREDGHPYPPSTLRSLLSGINRVLQSNHAPFSVLDKTNPCFRDLLKTLDSVSSDLHRQGVRATKHSAPIISQEHEELFWKKGLLGLSSPKVLQCTVFYYVGLNFVLRGVQEQHDLVPAQFVRVPSDFTVYDSSVYFEYTEFISKNNQHRFKDVNAVNKCVRAYALPGSNQCIVKLLDNYLRLLPPNSVSFYLCALDEFPTDPKKYCFVSQRVGVNVLKNIVPDMSRQSECGVHYTNHSLRATAITRMFISGVPEKIIAENSGHKSTKALHCYERTSSEQQKAVSKVISNLGDVFQPSAMECFGSNKSLKATPEPSPLTRESFQPLVEEFSGGTKVALGIPQPNPFAHTFSGSFSNCTINVSLK